MFVRPKCFGKFEMTHSIVENSPHKVADILSEISFVPYRVESLLARQVLVYEGWSPLFDLIEEGQELPIYDLLMHEEDDGIRVEVAKRRTE